MATWRLKYKFDGKEKLLALGAYPSISLEDARELRKHHKSVIAKSIDPNQVKKQIKETQKQEKIKTENTFEKIARERLKKQK